MKEVIVRLTSDHIKVKGGEYVQDFVRCQDCKHWVSDGGALMICDIHKDPTVPEHFCSYGEPNSSEKPNNSTRSILEQVGKE